MATMISELHDEGAAADTTLEMLLMQVHNDPIWGVLKGRNLRAPAFHARQHFKRAGLGLVRMGYRAV